MEKLHSWFWWGNLREGGHLEDSGVDGKIILKWIFKKKDWGHGLTLWLGSIKCGVRERGGGILDQLRTCQLLKKDSAQ